MNRNELFRLKYYFLWLIVLFSGFIYAGLTGRRILGSDSQKWAPEQHAKGYHK